MEILRIFFLINMDMLGYLYHLRFHIRKPTFVGVYDLHVLAI